MKSYWHCIVEVDIPEGCMPDGADLPMREGILESITKLHENAEMLELWSGWGLSEKGAENVLNEACKGENVISRDHLSRRKEN